MKTAEFTLPGIKTARDTAERSLHAVALYDGLVSLVYAQEALNAMAQAASLPLSLHRTIWSFSTLMRLDVRHESIRVASEADIIIVASSSPSSMPSHVSSWLNTCLRENGKGPPVLVALDEEGPEPEDATPVLHADLRAIATRWGVSLLCNTEFDERLENNLTTELAGRNEYRLGSDTRADFERLLSFPPVWRWGLNE